MWDAERFWLCYVIYWLAIGHQLIETIFELMCDIRSLFAAAISQLNKTDATSWALTESTKWNQKATKFGIPMTNILSFVNICWWRTIFSICFFTFRKSRFSLTEIAHKSMDFQIQIFVSFVETVFMIFLFSICFLSSFYIIQKACKHWMSIEMVNIWWHFRLLRQKRVAVFFVANNDSSNFETHNSVCIFSEKYNELYCLRMAQIDFSDF